MKRVFGCIALVVLLGCQGSNDVTGPSTDYPEVTPAAETAPTPAAPAEGTGHTGIHISQTGTITLSIDEVLTACLYDATVAHNQNLLNTYKVRQGKNPLQYPDPPKCGNIRLQVDVQEGATCPPKAHPFVGYRGGLAFVYEGGECPTPTPTPTPKPSPTPTPKPSPTPTPQPTPTPPPICVVEVDEVIEEIFEGPWSECTQGGHSSVSASCNETECHQTRDRFKIITTTYTCDEPPKTERVELKGGHRQCECPAVAACYYTPDCRFGGGEVGASTACPNILKAAMCVAEGGQWSNWNGASNQCKTDLPGIYKSNFRLVPGQSDAACLKFTGHD